MKVRRILVPVDYSGHSRRAIENAVSLADQLGAKVEVLHVVAPPVTNTAMDHWIWGENRDKHAFEREVRKAHDKAFKEVVDKLPAGVRSKITSRMEVGAPPSKVIIDLLERDPYDLVVMASHGHTGAKHVLVGSTTERVIRRSKTPVLTVH